MSGHAGLVVAGAPRELHDLCAREIMLSGAFRRPPEGQHEHAGAHDPFRAESAGLKGNVEQTALVFKLRRLIDKETGVKVKGHNAATPTDCNSATLFSDESSLNSSLQPSNSRAGTN